MELSTGSGIYLIRCVPTGKVYVGQASNLRVRWLRHRTDLMAGRHHCKPLLRAWLKYGREAFEFDVLELVDPPLLTEREDHYIEALKASVREHGFNLAPAAGSLLGIKHGSYSKERIDKATAARTYHRGRHPTEETRAKMSAAATGRKHTAETRAKCGVVNKGRKHTPEARAKIGEASRGHTLAAASRDKISTANRGKVRSPEARAKNAAAKRAMWADPEFRAKMSAMRRGKKPSPEAIAKTAAANRGKKHSPERVAKATASRRRNRLLRERSIPRSRTERQMLLFS